MESTAPPFRPLSVSDLVDETFQMYRRNFLLFISITAVLVVPLAAIHVLQEIAVQRQSTTSGIVGVSFMSLVVILLRYLADLAVLTAVIYAASEIRMGRKPSISEAYFNGMERFAAVIRVSLLLVVALGLICITIIGIPFAIYLGVAWALAVYVAVLENEGAWDSAKRSRDLVKGNWWRVLGVTFLIGLIVFLVQAMFAIPSALLNMPVQFFSSSTTSSASAITISTTLDTIGTIVTGPIIYIACLLLYYDLRARKEGLDLELMADQSRMDAQTAAYHP
ncbi:MAG: glycerophosphoryl diester phosphodiesterase membrane domain-containing protein [Nitrolancea sp.]